MQPGDKAALLMVHFGTTYDDTRTLTIDAINQKAKETFKGIEVREAWTSRIIMRRMTTRGVERLNPAEALEKLKAGTVLLVGHGTYTPATAQYAMLDYMLKAKGFDNYHVGTIEGYPSFDDMVTG